MTPDFPSDLFARLRRAQTEADVHGAYMGALTEFDGKNARTIEETGARLACCAGCSLCCWLRVDVYAHEVFLIAQHIRSFFSELELAELKTRLAVHSESVGTLTPMEHATRNVPCPLLVAGRCSVYAVRPMACRRQHSLALAACEYTFANPTDLAFPSAHQPRLFQTLTAAMASGAAVYAELGYDRTIYELGTALEEALLDDESWQGWLNHMEAFVRASITPVAPLSLGAIL